MSRSAKLITNHFVRRIARTSPIRGHDNIARDNIWRMWHEDSRLEGAQDRAQDDQTGKEAFGQGK